MWDIEKIIVFLFVVIFLFYMIRLSLFTRQKWQLKTYTFRILFMGLLLITTATFLDMISPVISTKFTYILMRACFTLGAIFYIIGVILWSNYTKEVIEKFEELALKDSMTSLLNRKGMEKIYNTISKGNSPFYVVICDLDEMKKINDKYGHLQGDKYITSTAKIIVDAIGEKGYIGRIGGDEFVIILEYEDIEKVEETVIEIKQSVHEIFPGKNTGISLGYSLFPDDGKTLEDLIKIADERMYNDKQTRKKRV
ncbi:diguanylate cyclase (GGDEF)-like protein [Clostridium tetanomorphum]|uniref:GGDEF domain-containing protein n=1 Tax=Clostridium tetanomorphum TaxID=1553 RepID=A0A923J2T2_CLOTT|nr:GGDEF domain-containing protein [Clostridium tetanomorphum]KAJ51709.1 diguanylate cyclase/phosphodiesterase [Clostridium tetanomorphum DSM 665]MBC2399115.1 GGDEF domain-containing protein [Clostridium tetanomorphum]MBP1865925.1 diguanylate cyclase (GGDEF)-like protein [Clostridium tetanomorphum]NRS86106.1 diguanylate cyclase (GGDEF)-like protein [Clostridium tetanomorphum]NRZ95873.1 diguanylate cyclase (GGDEF)-like protein [Clostridium tetanomorphum]